ncbi:alpha/beta hydrolase [Phreatobacter sp. AB_2022a]|uniref:alpha/beta hydrolase n=1 Tax=Phreatobacter sp. AB_2022a TaxID=3003134 RepID=UPI0022874CE3|nr:alpha/beta hydrolase [Phreatobacter sp. AB_2022a]MCZ0736311.1 alpha/beta hydrolase [Phreatobacter sp. AB_2022a]
MTAETAPVERVKSRIAAVFGRWSRETTMAEMRADYEAMLAAPAVEAGRPFAIGAMPAEWIIAEGADPGRAILFLHGGGYQIGSVRSHRDLMRRLSRAAGAAVLGIDYRLAPENRFPAAVDDGLAAYRWLLEQGFATGSIALAGDSAGGGLAVAVLLKACAEGLALPAAAALFSPWTDMEASGATYETRAAVDTLTQRDKILLMARAYLGRGGDPRDPLASPIHADLSGLPPMLIHVGDHETILDDSRVFADRARAAGVAVELTIWDRMIHQFQVFAGDIPEAQASIEAAGAFLHGRFAAP